MDQDGTISRPLSLGIYLKDWESFAFREDAVLVMEELAADGFSFIVLTNQAGIGHGIVEQDEADRIHQRMTVELANRGVPILETYCCPDLPGSGSPMRKPAPGMFLQAFSVQFCRRSPDVLDEVRRVLVEVSGRR